MSLPFLLVGDHPSLPSGLGRILRDIAQHASQDPSLDLDVRIVGCRPEGAGPDGHPTLPGLPVWSFTASDDLGQAIVDHVRWAWQRWWGTRPGIVMTIWDAARIHALAHTEGPWEHWAYVPVDGAMVGGGWYGAPAEAIARVSRVLAYGQYGARLLRGVRGTPVPFLPHGLDESWFTSTFLQGGDVQERRRWIGCVMTNQPRKDWGLTLATLAVLRERGHKVKLWAHVDRAIGPSWNLHQLLAGHSLHSRTLQLSFSGDHWEDHELQQAYRRCGVLILPTHGEGFGYPLVEALASGVPCVHSTEAGGAEFVPRPEWRVPVTGTRIEGPYGIVRPVFDPKDWANAIERVWGWQDGWRDLGHSYCQGAVEYLRWERLWLRWRSWIRQGIEARED